MVDVLIKGFKSTEEAEEFITWYSEQGEQDLGVWLESVASEKVRDFLQCNCKKTFPIKVVDNTIPMYIEE